MTLLKRIFLLIPFSASIYFVFQKFHCEPEVAFSKYSAVNLALEKRFGARFDTNEPGYETDRNFTGTVDHPIFQKFYIKEPVEKKQVNIIIIVSSAPKRIKRRYMIRKTWWRQCVRTKSITPECIFLTDYQGPDDEYFDLVHTEKMLHDDIHFHLVESGVTRGKRFLLHMLYAESMYKYDYYLKLDDNQFVCLEKILFELPIPVEKRFHWGWVHLPSEIRRPEESIIMFSHDVVVTFLTQDPERFLCHPLADQMISAWLTDLGIKTLLRHDNRIHHVPPLREVPYLKSMANVCDSFIAIHGVYDKEMLLLWKNRGTSLKSVNGNLKNNSIRCVITTPFQWTYMGDKYRFQPKLCISDPKWDTSKLFGNSPSYSGRE